MFLEEGIMKLLLTLLITVYLSGCTVAGVLIDGHAQNNNTLNQNMNSESPRVHRRPVCLSQATLPDSFKLS